MPITAGDLGLSDEEQALWVLVNARLIAPCIDSFADESVEKKTAIAILKKGVIAELPDEGFARAKQLSRNGTSITLSEAESMFSAEARAALRSLCPAATGMALPLGSFPKRSGLVDLWDEGAYT